MKAASDNLVEFVWNAGVVGAGGAGFPTWKKIDARVKLIIVNGAECEPLLRNDQRLMAVDAQEIIRGLKLVMNFTDAEEGVIALKKKYTTAIKALDSEIKGEKKVRLHLLDSVYPAGDEFVIVYEVTGMIIPPGEIPLKVGILVSNVETFRNISRAEQERPVISRNLTITGAVKRPLTIELPIGTSVGDALELAGGPAVDDWAIIIGGPMMGEVTGNINHPITKTTSAIIVLPSDHPVVIRKTRNFEFDLRKVQSTCCQCDYCTLVCPRALLGHNFKPHIIMRQLAMGIPIPVSPLMSGAALCCNCDLCGVYSCPMNLPIGRLNQQIANQIKVNNWETVPALPKYSPSYLRKFRQIPVSRLTTRLKLMEYDRDIPHYQEEFHPDTVTIPLKQHIGGTPRAVVKENQQVKEGDLIGDLESGTIGARVHASINGKIKNVSNESIVISAS